MAQDERRKSSTSQDEAAAEQVRDEGSRAHDPAPAALRVEVLSDGGGVHVGAPQGGDVAVQRVQVALGQAARRHRVHVVGVREGRCRRRRAHAHGGRRACQPVTGVTETCHAETQILNIGQNTLVLQYRALNISWLT